MRAAVHRAPQSRMQVDVSVILPLRNVEGLVAPMVRQVDELVGDLERPAQGGNAPRRIQFEILALDERSGDNTLSVLSVLHGQVAALRTLQELEPGSSIRRASRVARGSVWLIVDRLVDPELCSWGLRQALRGHRAALVPGELLVVDHELGRAAFARLGGGLVSAQHAVVRQLRALGERPVRSPAPDRGMVDRALTCLRGHLPRIGLGALDRPYSGRGSIPEGGLL